MAGLPTVRQLQIFVAVARFRSFSRSAQALGITQSALSQAVAQMEFLLDIPLIQRNRRHVALTTAGQAFLPHAIRILDDLSDAINDIKANADPLAGKVTVACMTSTLRLLRAVITRFRVRHTGPIVHIREEDAVGIAEHVRSGDVDLAISVMFKQDLSLDFLPLIEDRLHLVCRRDHAFAARESMSWGELGAYEASNIVQWSGIDKLVVGAGPACGANARAVFSVSRISTVLDIVAESGLVSVLPTLALSGPSISRSFYHCPMVEPEITRSIGLITSRERPFSPAAAALREVLLEVVSEFTDDILPDVTFVYPGTAARGKTSAVPRPVSRKRRAAG